MTLNEWKELFEIKGDNVFKLHNGPRNARLSKKGLFDTYEFLFVGDFDESTITLATVMELAKLCGASIKNSASDFTPNTTTTVTTAAATATVANKVIIFDETKLKLPEAKAKRIKETSNITCVNKSWFLDSLARYSILDTKQYETYS